MVEKRLVLVIKILIFAALIVPLIVMGNSYIFPFVFPKAIYFRIVTEIMLALYIILCVVNKDFLPRRSAISLATLFWVLALFLACVFGADFNRSFWGNFERMSGWYTLVHFAIFSLITSAIARNWNDWKWLLRWSLVLGLIVGCTGLKAFVPENSILRMGGGGSLGNSIYISNFILFNVLIAWYLLRKETNKFWKGYALVLGLLGIWIIFVIDKRGPFIGLLGGIFLGALLYGLFSKEKKIKILTVTLLMIIVLSGVGIFSARKTSFILNLPIIGNLANTSLSSGTAETRLIAWNIAIQAWKEKPVFGWGPENFYYAFNKYYNPRSLEHGYYETWFDRSHNIFLDYLSTSGIVGFLSYLGLFVAIGWVLVKSYLKKQIDLDFLVFISVFFTAYAIQNVFVFDHLSSYLLFFLILAMTDIFCTVEKENVKDKVVKIIKDISKKKNNEWPIVVSIFVGLVALVVIYQTNIKPAQANNLDFQAQRVLQSNLGEGFSKIKEALATSQVNETDMRSDFSRAILSLSVSPEVRKDPVFNEAVKFSMDETRQTILDHPLEIQGFLLLGQYYAMAGQLNEAQKLFSQAQSLSPRRQQVAYMWVRLKMAVRDFDGSIALLNKTRDDDTKIPDTYWYLSLVYAEKGDKELAWQNLKEAIANGKDFAQKSEGEYALSILDQHQDWDAIKSLGERLLLSDQNNSKILLELSKAYAALGDTTKAKEMADRAAVYDKTAVEQSKKWLK